MYFTILTGIESVLPGTSDLGVITSIELSYAMRHEGRKESGGEVSSPDMCMRVHHMVTWHDFGRKLTIARNRRLRGVRPITSCLGSDLI